MNHRLSIKKAMAIMTALAIAIAMGLNCITSPKDNTTPFPHTQPAQVSMLPDLGSINGPQVPGKKLDGDFSGHQFTAGLTVGIWNLLVVANLAIPVAVYATALSQGDPVLTDSGYVWTYTHNQYQAKLLGTIENLQIVWKMRISGPGLNDDFLWYRGGSNFTGTQGDWLFYQKNSTDSLVTISWTASADTSLSFVSRVDTSYGDSLRYGRDGSTRTFLLTDVSKGESADIQWDAATFAGSILAPNYNSGQKGCWIRENGVFVNATCAP